MANSSQPKTWRDVLPIHPAAELFPPIPEAELKELARDIEAHGLQTPVVVWNPSEDPDDEDRYLLLDGRSRLDALALLGLLHVDQHGVIHLNKSWNDKTWLAYETPFELLAKHRDGDDPYALALSLNLHRRHLTTEQKRELIAKLVKAKPEASNLQVAKQVKADDKTVAKVRSELEARSEIPNVKIRTDTKGRKQAAHKSTNRRPSGRRQTITDLNSLAWSNASHGKRAEFVRNVGLVHIWEEADDDQQTALAALIEKIVDQHLKDEKDEDVFTAIVTNLARLTKKNNAERFGNTSLPFKDLRELGHFFLDLANVCQKKRQAEHDAKLEVEVAAILGGAAP